MKFVVRAAFPLLAAVLSAAEPETLSLWPGKAPGTEGLPNEELIEDRTAGKAGAEPDRRISKVTEPSLLVFRPARGTGNRAAVVICPGGGYRGLSWDKEGCAVGEFLSGLGYTAAVLKYRMPRPDLTGEGLPWPQQDARRALRLLRANAAAYDIDPNKIGLMGFSAGGHLAASCGVLEGRGDPAADDPVDRMSAQPNFLILVYPVITMRSAEFSPAGSRSRLLGEDPSPAMRDRYSPEFHVTDKTRPAFLVHAKDDGVRVENSLLFAETLKRAGVPCELCLFETGGHAFGLAKGKAAPLGEWPQRLKQWLERIAGGKPAFPKQ